MLKMRCGQSSMVQWMAGRIFISTTGVGTKTLTVPSGFCWTAQEVAKLGTNKQAIMAVHVLASSLDAEVIHVHIYTCALVVSVV